MVNKYSYYKICHSLGQETNENLKYAAASYMTDKAFDWWYIKVLIKKLYRLHIFTLKWIGISDIRSNLSNIFTIYYHTIKENLQRFYHIFNMHIHIPEIHDKLTE